MNSEPAVSLGAILLAGGRATRMGGVAKPLLEVGGRSLLQRAIDACAAAGCSPITVVGPSPAEIRPEYSPQHSPDATPDSSPDATPDATPDSPPDAKAQHSSQSATTPSHPAAPPLPRTVRWAREDPPFSGPAAAVAAALATWESAPEWTFVLACDLPLVDAAVPRLVSDMLLLPSDTDGLCLADASSRPQWLTGVYRTAALARAAAGLADGGRNASIRALLDDLAIAVVAAPDDIAADVDTWQDLEEARARADRNEGTPDD